MRGENAMSGNHLTSETSPYLLQHAYNPVDWYPWGEEAFQQAREKDRPVFLSIGYSTCHWCHVMAHESFEDAEIAKLLNEYFVAVKVDREERPDLDSVYMTVCQAVTGSGGWPMSLFLTPERKPFFAGTYFPKDAQRGMPGFRQLLTTIAQKWREDRASLLSSAEAVQSALTEEETAAISPEVDLLERAVEQFRRSFDAEYGGFGGAPKFPTPHNLLFLLDRYRKTGDKAALHMAEVTLRQMHRGGLYDHIGFGFCRYSTDHAFQIPHFEKMLYDNALLTMAYVSAFDATGNRAYLRIAEQIADYVLREMTAPDGGFYSAQDADSDSVEGRYYALRPAEVCEVLGVERGERFNRCYGITEHGNFNGRSIPHLVGSPEEAAALEPCLPALRTYRKERCALHLDDKTLTSWNALMIAALSQLSRVTGSLRYLDAAKRGMAYLETYLAEGDRLFVSHRDGRRGCAGFLDDYACTIFALLQLQQVTQEIRYVQWANCLCTRAVSDFWDDVRDGFYLSGKENESLILRPKETYDGALPSGNAVMACDLVRLSEMAEDSPWEEVIRRQMAFLSGAAAQIPMGHAFFLLALSDSQEPPDHVTVALGEDDDSLSVLKRLPLHALVTIPSAPTPEFPLLNGKTTYYVCTDKVCLPPSNHPALLKEV
jgi:uncharacterized protein YyaL (SSP411 family)